MKLKLYSETAPSGRCLLIANAIADIARISDGECLRIASDLFNARYTKNSPAVIIINEDVDLKPLIVLCRDYNIELSTE